ncbi:helix-turn-helix transcriptional regulator [Natrialba asiatica]|uniref:Transcriptional regulator PadR family protein n=1 Tax=Natrialba asiatica (strain ATCC 700177 / DSM 12278 / JCM 9576 / FERM P-10747 / NBRC 102637 / 172P1) TaxID=29540 RepID=M0AL58_NATA1|nr:helix-turn-helix transcriptional regulator [Natrialba asiatica]ELY99455.1 transcriptional regulator PadR family protein [Natrialba asiatica DSM 12278]
MNARSPYTCDTPGCTNWKEVFTPDGYVCEDCAGELAEDYDAEPELVADGGIAWGDLSGFQRDILETIAGLESAGMDPYGLAIEENLEEYYGDVPHSRLYQNLNGLIEDGLVERSELDGRTNSYTLTPDAETLLEESVRRRAEACEIQIPATDGGNR